MSRPATGQVVVRIGKRGKVYALRFRAYGQRQYVTLGEDWTPQRAEEELQNVLADVRRGIWQPPAPTPIAEQPEGDKTFHEFASEWVERHRRAADARTVEAWLWALELHLLPQLGRYPLSQITAELVDRYREAKLRESDERRAELLRWQRERAADPDRPRSQRPKQPLSDGSINKTLKMLAQVLDDAVDYNKIATNPARGRNRRLKASKPRRIWLELDEIRSLLAAAGNHRALVATMILSGLRVSELCALRWRAIEPLARGKLTVEESKTEAGEGREVDLTPDLISELKLYRAAHMDAGPDDLVFPTRTGSPRDRNNVRSRILLPALARANAARAEAGLSPIPHVTNHTLRRTFCSLLYEAGATPAYAMAQMGHTSAALALEVYAKVMERSRDTGERMDAMLRPESHAGEAELLA